MSTSEYLIDTNILIYHTAGSKKDSIDFISNVITKKSFNISILTKIEFLGWDKHTPDGFEKCKQLIEPANIYPVEQDIANKAIELKRERNIKLADAVIAANVPKVHTYRPKKPLFRKCRAEHQFLIIFAEVRGYETKYYN